MSGYIGVNNNSLRMECVGAWHLAPKSQYRIRLLLKLHSPGAL